MVRDSEFVHLHVHTDYSLLDGACRIDHVFERASELGMKALAMTDHGNLFGVIDFYKTGQKYGIKPLVGCEVYLVYNHKLTEKPERGKHKYYHMGLIAQNFVGYQNLIQLVSEAHTKGFYYKPRTDMEHLAIHAEGLIGFTGCLQGVVPQFLLQNDMQKAREAMGRFIDIFGKDRYFVEIQDHGIDLQHKIVPGLLQLASEFGLKVICSNDVHYVKASDWAPHDSLLCIQTGTKLADEKRLRYASRQFYLKDRQEMDCLFKEIPEAVTNTCCVAEMCDLKIPFGENHYPVFERPIEILSHFKDNFQYIHYLCKEGLKERYGVDYDTFKKSNQNTSDFLNKNDSKDLAKTLVERLDYELDIIQKTGFLDYFLIVWDFIRWAREQGIPVGPGRGSGAGCIVAYLLKITDIDPIRFKLLFERFLNPERISPPDFDIDFCMRRRGEVVDYVRRKYGEACVANIITFGTFGAKMIVRDLARINDLPYSEGDRIAKMIPDDLKITLADALDKSKELQLEVGRNPLVAKMIEQGKIIEGMVRNTGTHAAGIIIGDRPLTEWVPVTLQDGVLTTQYPKDPVEELGLLKMDFLGLTTLTVIDHAQGHVRITRNKPDFDIEKVGFDDAKTFQLLNEGKTVGVFQLEGGGMQSLCRQFNISSIDEIVALIALYRPGPMEWIPDYIKGKKDPSTIQFPHPLLEDICRETYGIMVYQEQVMEAAKLIAGYTLGGADVLRRAMGKKKIEEMALQRAIFVEGAKIHNQITEKKAGEIFDILEKFAGYGFNKSHSAAYAILAYRTAYLKANYPVEFMAAMLSAVLGNADKVAHFIDECASMRVSVLGPDINISRENFTPIIDAKTRDHDGAEGIQKDDLTGQNKSHKKSESSARADEFPKTSGAIRFGLSAIKGVGDAASCNILEERNRGAPFKDFVDFLNRVDLRIVNKRVIECLIRSGAFDGFHVDRQHLLDSMESIMKEVSSLQKDREAGQASLFDFIETHSSDSNSYDHTPIKMDAPVMKLDEKLKHEKELLGFYVSGHPMNKYAGFDEIIHSIEKDTLDRLSQDTPFRLCGVVCNVVKRISKRNNQPWAMFALNTKKTSFNLSLFPQKYEELGYLLEEGKAVMIEGKVRVREGEVSLNIQAMNSLDSKIQSVVKVLRWIIRSPHKNAKEDCFEKEIHEVDKSPQEDKDLILDTREKVQEEVNQFLNDLSNYIHACPGNVGVQLGFLQEDDYVLDVEIAGSLRCGLDFEKLRLLKESDVVEGIEVECL